MHARDFFGRAADLERARTPFALAIVVKRESPVSSHLGDRAIVFADGRMQGFVGGSCSRDIVRRQAVDALRSGMPRLVQIRPGEDPEPTRIDRQTVVVGMTCASEGEVEVYIEPHLPARTLIVVGFTPVADELARFGAQLEGYRVVRVVDRNESHALAADTGNAPVAVDGLRELFAGMDPGDRARVAAVIASQGHYDETALEALLADGEPAYVGLLASRKRAADVFDAVAARGIGRERLARVRNPAGLDIGAIRAGEVALSILAQIVEETARAEPQAKPCDPEANLTVDPVCGMDVEADSAAHSARHEGREYHFCCIDCRTAFEADPERYATALEHA